MSIKYNKSTLNNLEQIFKESEYSIRYEKGQFRSGYCIIHNKKIIIINKFFDTKGRIENLLDILSDVEIEESVLSDKSKSHLHSAQSFNFSRKDMVA